MDGPTREVSAAWFPEDVRIEARLPSWGEEGHLKQSDHIGHTWTFRPRI